MSGLTIRVDGDRVLASDDRGHTVRLPFELAANLQDHFASAAATSATAGPSAATIAALAEARATRPQTRKQPSPAWQNVSEGPRVDLSEMISDCSDTLAAVLARRRSQREWAPPNLSDVATLLVRCCQILDWAPGPDGYVITHRPVPSAGARHPLDVHVLASEVNGLGRGCWRFDALRCELVETGLASDPALSVLGNVLGCSPPPAALVAVANLPRTLSRYPTGLSLVWRDAGALLSSLHLCATDVGLASCIVGTCGILVDEHAAGVVDVGALAVGVQHVERDRGTQP